MAKKAELLTAQETIALRAAFAIAYPLSHRGNVSNLTEPYSAPPDQWQVFRLFHEFMLRTPDEEEVRLRTFEAKAAIDDELGALRERHDAEQQFNLTGKRPAKAQVKANTAKLLLDIGSLDLEI